MRRSAAATSLLSTRQLLAPVDPSVRKNYANENMANAVVNAPGFRSSLRGNILHIKINNLPADLFGRASIAVSAPLMSPDDAIAPIAASTCLHSSPAIPSGLGGST